MNQAAVGDDIVSVSLKFRLLIGLKESGMGKFGWVLAMVLPMTAQASYVESCEITGKVLQDTSTRTRYMGGPQGEYEVSDLQVTLKIKKVKRSGRADNQCAAFTPRTPLEINIKPAPLVTLQRGQSIRVGYFKKHNQGQEATESYQLLQP